MSHSKQIDLPLRSSGWGGRRPGAGRKPGPNPAIRHSSRERFAARFPCHVTVRVRTDVPSLRTVKLVREMERSLPAVRERRDFRVVHYSLQSNHAHFIVEATGGQALGRGMKSLGARLARAVNRVFDRRGPVLEERYHLRVLRTPREVRSCIAYVLLNAKKHAGRAAARGTRLDPASSSRWFDGWKRAGKGREGRQGRETPRAVAAARTWLLRSGWARHGRIDLWEIPGPAPAPG